jgi:hypothetical protein
MVGELSPFSLLLAMYAGFAALLFVSGYIYKTARDRRNKRMAPTFDFERQVEVKSRKEKTPPVVAAR